MVAAPARSRARSHPAARHCSSATAFTSTPQRDEVARPRAARGAREARAARRDAATRRSRPAGVGRDGGAPPRRFARDGDAARERAPPPCVRRAPDGDASASDGVGGCRHSGQVVSHHHPPAGTVGGVAAMRGVMSCGVQLVGDFSSTLRSRCRASPSSLSTTTTTPLELARGRLQFLGVLGRVCDGICGRGAAASPCWLEKELMLAFAPSERGWLQWCSASAAVQRPPPRRGGRRGSPPLSDGACPSRYDAAIEAPPAAEGDRESRVGRVATDDLGASASPSAFHGICGGRSLVALASIAE